MFVYYFVSSEFTDLHFRSEVFKTTENVPLLQR